VSGPAELDEEGRSPLSAARVAGYVTTLGLLSYLPLRALQEGFYLEFAVTGAEIGLDEATVLTRAAVLGAFFVGLLSLLLIMGGVAGRRLQPFLGRRHVLVRVLVVCSIALLPVVMKLLMLLDGAITASPATMPVRDMIRMAWVFVPLALAVGVSLLYEDILARLGALEAKPPFFLLAVGVLFLAFMSAVAFGVGSQMAVESKFGNGRPSLATEFLLSRPVRDVIVENANAPQQGGVELPGSGLLLGIDSGVAFVYADGTLWRLPQSSIVLASGR
jgi:hypothetical protein